MRRELKILCAVLAVVMLCTLPITAASPNGNETGVTNLAVTSGYTVTPQKADGTAAPTFSDVNSGKTAYDGAEKFALSFAGTSGTEYAVFLLDGGATVPTQSNIRYIDQATGDGSESFNVYPDTLAEDNYTMLVASKDGVRTAATFTVSKVSAGTRGDVTGDGTIAVNDATAVLRYVAKLDTPTADQKTLADTSGDGSVAVNDATLILRYVAKLITEF